MDKISQLKNIYYSIDACSDCGLCKNRIPGVLYSWRGSEDAKIAIIGEAFGKTENEVGKPFIGRCGKLLDKLLTECGLSPENDVYITNVVKDRPVDGNKDRKPFIDEIKYCYHFFIEELKVVKPHYIITLGKTAGDIVIGINEYKINSYCESKRCLPLYHPAYLLRNPSEIEIWKNTLTNFLKENKIRKAKKRNN